MANPAKRAQCITHQGKPLKVTVHALDRFVERWDQIEPIPLHNPLRTIKKILSHAEKEKLEPVSQVKRLLNNDCIEAEYWINSGWRFVIIGDDDERCLVTIERKGKGWG